MGDITFSSSVGRRAAVAGPAIRSGAVLDHAIHTAQLDAAQKKFTANSANTKEITDLYNAAVKDGRFIRELSTDPAKVAQQLNMPLSTSAAGEMKAAAGLAGNTLSARPLGPGTVAGSVTVVCIAVVVVLCADTGPNSRIIVDRSGALKL